MNKKIKECICRDIKAALQQLKKSGKFKTEAFPYIYLEFPKTEAHGDLSSNIAMQIAKTERKSPMQIAHLVVDNLNEKIGKKSTYYNKVEIANPGFINFFISNNCVYDLLKEILIADKDFGKSVLGKEKTVNIEFVSANPTGPLTVGHGRNAVIGDTLANVFKFAGYDVTREYYFNDAGTQMTILGDSVRLRYLELLGEKIDFPDNYYQGEYIKEIAKQVVDEYGDKLKDSDLKPFKEKAEAIIFDDIKSTLKKIGIIFDKFFNEHNLYTTGKIDQITDRLKELRYAYEKDGALWFRAKKFGSKDDRVIVRKTGEPTYRLPDICYHLDKIGRGYDLIIDVLGADHHATVPDVMAGVKALGYSTNNIKVLLHQFVTLKGGKMSTRTAAYVTLYELIDEIGKDAVRFFYMMRKMNSHLDFDLELAKSQSMDNPVYYIQYAHARICSIFKKFIEKTKSPARPAKLPDFSKIDPEIIELLKDEKEIKMIKMLSKFPQLIEDIVQTYEGHRLNDYLMQVAAELHSYHNDKVRYKVVSDDADLTLARLSLMKAFQIVIKNGLNLLSITAPESM